MRTIQNSARHLLSLINDLLDLAKIESGKVELHVEIVSCESVLEEVVTTLRPLAEAKGLRFLTSVPESKISMQTDRRALNQILLNLTNNAIKFTDTGTIQIEFSQRQANGTAGKITEISVTDTGVGMKAEEQARLFQAFEQLDKTSTRRHEGTGLGLYLSQKLAGLLGGRIDFESVYGQGSRFTLSIMEK